jgi:para-aminobenzoate synthetase component 1
MFYPSIQEISYQYPIHVFSHFSEWNDVVFLDSAERRENCGRYSFIAIDPFAKLVSKNNEIFLNDTLLTHQPFQVLAMELAKYPLATLPDLPPFQGGIAGLFSYDLIHHLEKIKTQQFDDMQFPDIAIGFYDLVIAFDELEKRAFIFSSGFPLIEAQARKTRAEQRIQFIVNELTHIQPMHFVPQNFSNHITMNFTQEEYETAVKKVIEYILAGDIFEANISQCFHAELSQNFHPLSLYQQLREVNPAPFASFLRFDDTLILSASPERFLKLQNNIVETRPIKGTRPRGKTVNEDKKNAEELLNSPKDHAENIMIVDLLRNDLSRVCQDHSVEVPQLCHIESYATVHHLVSVVKGELQAGFSALDLLQVAFPGGSITGAPKIRAAEIIAEIESTVRGPYCGSIGYIGFNGDMDTSIVIRTFAIKNHIATFQAGGAIVLDSHPREEYEETLTKAKALKKALQYDFSH